MSEQEAKIEEFVNKVITADRLQLAGQIIATCDLCPEEMRNEATALLQKMAAYLDQ